MLSRRSLLAASAATAAAAGLATLARAQDTLAVTAKGYGPLLPDPAKLLDVPKGFSYAIVSRQGETMSDGLLVPRRFDGMASFKAPSGDIVLVRNHELMSADPAAGPFGANYALLKEEHRGLLYDRGAGGQLPQGGTTTLVLDAKSLAVKYQALSLGGTIANCAGGATPWGSWLSCEETIETVGEWRARDHGYVFEVPGTMPSPAVPLPLKAMGRFSHEACAVDPRTGIVYLTEDENDGLFYRFLPKVKGQLLEGGKLQALALPGRPRVSTGTGAALGRSQAVTWVDLPDPNLPKTTKAAEPAARFVRGEGMAVGRDGIYFACTEGGRAKRGQIWRYTPSRAEGQPGERSAPGQLTLIAEPNDTALLDMPDNLIVAPNGDLIICEDGEGGLQVLRGMTSSGRLYAIASMRNSDEFCGACFSPDGKVLFVNLQEAGLTMAIRGPWETRAV
jgi:uncharacterized protein